MRIAVLFLSLFVSARVLAGQTASQTTDTSGIDTIIELVKANMSEDLVIKTIQKQNHAYDLSPADLLKLQKAGVSEKIIGALLDPGSSSSTPATPAAPAAAPEATPQPPASNRSQPQAAEKNNAKGGGLFSGVKDSLGRNAQKSVDGLGNAASDAVGNLDKKPQGTAAKGNVTTGAKQSNPSPAAQSPQAKQSVAPAQLAPAAVGTGESQQQTVADRQELAKKMTDCKQQATKAHPEGGVGLANAYIACVQSPKPATPK
jgi:hypothetical protein